MVKTKKVIKKQEVKPLSPIAAKRQLAALEYVYETTGISFEAYDAAKAKINAALEKWSQQ
jgi:hypothetical protein